MLLFLKMLAPIRAGFANLPATQDGLKLSKYSANIQPLLILW